MKVIHNEASPLLFGDLASGKGLVVVVVGAVVVATC
jgi:hypothetical protein